LLCIVFVGKSSKKQHNEERCSTTETTTAVVTPSSGVSKHFGPYTGSGKEETSSYSVSPTPERDRSPFGRITAKFPDNRRCPPALSSKLKRKLGNIAENFRDLPTSSGDGNEAKEEKENSFYAFYQNHAKIHHLVTHDLADTVSRPTEDDSDNDEVKVLKPYIRYERSRKKTLSYSGSPLRKSPHSHIQKEQHDSPRGTEIARTRTLEIEESSGKNRASLPRLRSSKQASQETETEKPGNIYAWTKTSGFFRGRSVPKVKGGKNSAAGNLGVGRFPATNGKFGKDQTHSVGPITALNAYLSPSEGRRIRTAQKEYNMKGPNSLGVSIANLSTTSSLIANKTGLMYNAGTPNPGLSAISLSHHSRPRPTIHDIRHYCAQNIDED